MRVVSEASVLVAFRLLGVLAAPPCARLEGGEHGPGLFRRSLFGVRGGSSQRLRPVAELRNDTGLPYAAGQSRVRAVRDGGTRRRRPGEVRGRRAVMVR